MIPSRLATKDEILLVHSDKFYNQMESTKTASQKQLKDLEGTPRSVEHTNVIKIISIVKYLILLIRMYSIMLF
jgi:hypothetical protein